MEGGADMAWENSDGVLWGIGYVLVVRYWKGYAREHGKELVASWFVKASLKLVFL